MAPDQLRGIRASVAGAACMAAYLVMLAVRGSADWSGFFATVWYGLVLASAVLAFVGVWSALTTSPVSPSRRVVALSLSALSLCAAGAVVCLVLIVLSEHLTS